MSKNNSKKAVAKKATEANKVVALKTAGSKVTAVPSLKDLIAGTSDTVVKAVAERVGQKVAEAIPAPAKKDGPKTTAAKQLVKENKKAEEAAKKAPAKKAAKTSEKKETVASFMRRLITEGKSNEEVFDAAVKAFGIGEEKKHYPSWYRSEMKRKAKAEKAAPAAKKGKKAAKA